VTNSIVNISFFINIFKYHSKYYKCNFLYYKRGFQSNLKYLSMVAELLGGHGPMSMENKVLDVEHKSI
jgi:hypothetical protein